MPPDDEVSSELLVWGYDGNSMVAKVELGANRDGEVSERDERKD
jgi:hypothetical protein